jgi:hypothetical protein
LNKIIFRKIKYYRKGNPFLFIRGLFFLRSVQTSLTQNCLKLTIPGFPDNLLSVSCKDIGFLTGHFMLIFLTP